jgi:hypothetical protein
MALTMRASLFQVKPLASVPTPKDRRKKLEQSIHWQSSRLDGNKVESKQNE